MGASRPFRVRGVLLVKLIPLTRIAQARSDLSPAEVGYIRLRPIKVPNSGKPEFGRRGTAGCTIAW